MNQGGLFDPVDNLNDKFPDFAVSLMALAEVPGLGFQTIKKLVSAMGDRLGILLIFRDDELKDVLSHISAPNPDKIIKLISNQHNTFISKAESSVKGLKEKGIEILGPSELPKSLRSNELSPQWLFVQGNTRSLFRTPSIAVVGTRTPSLQGVESAKRAVRILTGYDITIVSGLAEGIDNEVHSYSLDRGMTNIAFLGHGIESHFPSSTAGTRKRILEKTGAIVTEYFPWERPQRSYFVQRNRLQALLTNLLLIVEAGNKSGTAHTYNFAKRFGKAIIGIDTLSSEITTLIKHDGYPVINVLNDSGMRSLDRTIKNITSSFHKPSKVIDRILMQLEYELRIRDLSRFEKAALLSQISATVAFALERSDDD